MGNMLRQIVAPLHDLGWKHDPFLPVSSYILMPLFADVHCCSQEYNHQVSFSWPCRKGKAVHTLN